MIGVSSNPQKSCPIYKYPRQAAWRMTAPQALRHPFCRIEMRSDETRFWMWKMRNIQRRYHNDLRSFDPQMFLECFLDIQMCLDL